MARKRILRALMLLAAALPVFVIGSAPAAHAVPTSLDFNISGIGSGGMICWDGPGTALSGSSIQVSQITANNGQSLGITGGVLTFTSGANTGYSSSDWTFGPGGTISIQGNIGSGAETLLSGTFTSAEVILVSGTTYQITIGGITNTNSTDLTTYFGMPSGQYVGAITATTLNGSVSGSWFTCDTALSGDVTDDPVPLPAAGLLFAPGLAGLIAMRKRLRA